MNVLNFTDVRIDEIVTGTVPITAEERNFLVHDTPRFEECTYTAEQLDAMSGKDLITAAYWVWADYASGQV